MNIQWKSLLDVLAVALGSTIAVVALVTLALLGLSSRTARLGPAPRMSPSTGTALAAACLTAAAAIVLLGLWMMIAR